jgi:hypothetical protein
VCVEERRDQRNGEQRNRDQSDDQCQPLIVDRQTADEVCVAAKSTRRHAGIMRAADGGAHDYRRSQAAGYHSP